MIVAVGTVVVGIFLAEEVEEVVEAVDGIVEVEIAEVGIVVAEAGIAAAVTAEVGKQRGSYV